MRRRILAAGLVATLVLTGCTATDSGDSGDNAANGANDTDATTGATGADGANGADGATDGDEDGLVLAVGAVANSEFNPLNGWGQHMEHKVLHSSLVKWVKDGDSTEDMKLTGDLAESWDQDGTTWTFHLRDDFMFSDGEPVTADDVVFTIETLREDGVNFDLSMVEDVRAEDDTTVVMELADYDTLFEPMLATIAILPEHAFDEDYSQDPIASGPYRVVEHQIGEQLIMEANPHYPEELTYQSLTFLLTDEDSALAAVDAGDVDIAYVSAGNADRDYEGMELKELESVDSLGIALPTQPAGQTSVTMGIEGPAGNDVTSDPAIRKALSLGVDRQQLNDLVLGGYGSPAFSFADHLPWYTDAVEFQDGDVDAAIELLSEAGWEDTNGDGTVDKDGVEAVVTLYYSATDPTRADLATGFAAQAEEIGIRFEPEGVSWDDIYADGKENAIIWALGSLSPKEIWETYATEAQEVGYNNITNYSNPEVDRYIDDARSSESLEASLDSWQAAQEAGAASNPEMDVPIIWLLRRDHLYLVGDGIDIGNQITHGHGHGLQIFNNVAEWQ